MYLIITACLFILFIGCYWRYRRHRRQMARRREPRSDAAFLQQRNTLHSNKSQDNLHKYSESDKKEQQLSLENIKNDKTYATEMNVGSLLCIIIYFCI